MPKTSETCRIFKYVLSDKNESDIQMRHGVYVAHVFEEIVPFDIDETLNEAG